MPLDGPENEKMQDDSTDEISESNKVFRHGRWTEEEHNKFLEALTKYGKKWKKIEEYVGTRSSTQARSHAQKYFGRMKEESQINKKNIFEISVVNRKKNEETSTQNDSQNIFKITKEHLPGIKRNLVLMMKQRSYSEFLNHNIFKIIEPSSSNHRKNYNNVEEESKESNELMGKEDNIILKIGEDWKSIEISDLSLMFDKLFQE